MDLCLKIVFLLFLLEIALAMFYTNSKENDFPRIGKRPKHSKYGYPLYRQFQMFETDPDVDIAIEEKEARDPHDDRIYDVDLEEEEPSIWPLIEIMLKTSHSSHRKEPTGL